ncbi:MAG TPA: glycosyltransferase, partial [Candidatus Binatia bacterium]|nr:glycosyltransferase [Candidatus Binatia bacterium]
PLVPDRPLELAKWRQRYQSMVRMLLFRKGWVRANGHCLQPLRPLILWFYTPTPFYMVDLVPASLVVYDVMDELSNFKGAGDDLPEREAALLGKAHLVFAGGRSLYEARKGRHPNIHLFPSGVQPDHFAAANDPQTLLSPLLQDLPAPRLGYIGVIDERLDLDLLDRLAAEQPGWTLVMVGPVRKIEPESLPRRPNIHYLGSQPYDDLPQLLKGFDVCLMPFALNEATRSISPTKALEYMATHKPIVSSAVPDVVASWHDAVWIAEGAEGFAAAINCALNENDQARATRVQHERKHLAHSSWDAITGDMLALLTADLNKNRAVNGAGEM